MISNWTANDAIRASLGYGFGAFPKLVSMRVVAIADSGEAYFANGKGFDGMDTLMRELTDIAEDGKVSLRVALAVPTAGLYQGNGAHADLNLAGEDMFSLFLRCIGKGVDGKPVIRLGYDPGEGSGT